MNLGFFVPDQFVNDTSFNTAVGYVSGAFAALSGGALFPGLVRPDTASFAATGLTAGVSLPSPFQILFGSGVLASAHGVINGQDTQSYTISFSGVVPASGTTTAYLLASYQQIQQNPFVVIGPPPGHPDYNPNFQPYTTFATLTDSVALTASLSGADNVNSFELFRTTLAAGATGVATFTTSFQRLMAPLFGQQLVANSSPGTLTIGKFNYVQAAGTYTLPLSTRYNGDEISITSTTSGTVTIATSGADLVYGASSAPTSGMASFTVGQNIVYTLIAENGTWQIISSTAPFPFPITVPEGGTGDISLAAHTVLIGEGTSPIGTAGPGASGIPLVGQGASADPVFAALTVPGGGTGQTTLTAHGVLIGEGASSITAVTGAVSGYVLTWNTSGDPSFQQVQGLPIPIPVPDGGTGDTSLTAHGVLIGEGTAAVVSVTGSMSGTVLTWNASGDPSFQYPSVGHGSQVYGAAGVYTFTIPAPSFYVEMWGASGGGGGTVLGVDAQPNGGGGGAYAYKFFSGQTVGNTITVTIGGGGAGGATDSGNDGAAGGTTSFGAIIIITGGAGGFGTNDGNPNPSPPTSGGAASGGDVNRNGYYSGVLTGGLGGNGAGGLAPRGGNSGNPATGTGGDAGQSGGCIITW